uniref:EamA domain-containing protein n=1 Tax=Leptocylindrus danicus TaxID=163516 RepID=A0A7S2LFK2_9STRA|mmetsp:Transcript_4872/g.7094  ORF Transcript_4872/g.7094 Transcript_4872/m.7094 type:complete len:449 (+) Transcript_4872:72-1418(+)|eukprot:CAMPEP_0116022350 /NCGR_PEP_ID=MMETSP0321-20121206/10935_1 /TAXON_ID=163516 /ORGANISM="Leptocylindrus danicus var. danicus, Strain B650" /LENGTH=448 /DNA_ID=CAMNT_0003493405 /DNA_START=39 /DNA_END=1385 /DNA_ORIENTATION=+
MKNDCNRLFNAVSVLVVLSSRCHGFVPVSEFGAKQCYLHSSSSDAFCKVRKQYVRLNSSLKTPPEVDQKSEQKIGSFNPLNISSMPSNDKQLIDSAPSTTGIVENEEAGELGIIAARGLLLIVAMLWGTNFASVKYLETLCFHPPCNHPPSEFAFARFGVAALAGLPFLWKKNFEIIKAGLECGVLIALGYFAQAIALESIPSAQCAFICSLTVVIVPIYGAIFEGKPIKSTNVVAGLLALSGVAILEGLVDVNQFLPAANAAVTDVIPTTTTSAAANTDLAFGLSKGDLIALGQPFGFGLSFLRIEHYVEKFKDTEDRILTISAAQCVAVGLLSLGWVLYDFHGHIPNMEYMLDYHRLGAIAWTGIATTVFAIFLEGIALQTATATDASITFASEPVWAALFAAWLLNEKFGTDSYVGGSIILAACLLGALSDLKPVDKADAEENAR